MNRVDQYLTTTAWSACDIASKRLQIAQWTADQGEALLKQIVGGVVGDSVEISGRGLIALKLEVVR